MNEETLSFYDDFIRVLALHNTEDRNCSFAMNEEWHQVRKERLNG
jgi:hypothetical protein